MARLNTSITRLFNIRHPIMQGGMHYVEYAALAAAVANAGGLGLVTALTQPTPAELKAELEKAQALLDPDCAGALGVNLTILPMFKEVNYGEYVRHHRRRREGDRDGGPAAGRLRAGVQGRRRASSTSA